MRRSTIYFFLLYVILLAGCKSTKPFSLPEIKKQVFGKRAMVVTAHPLASKIGLDVIKKGGNAVDAAVAVQFALAVAFPVAGNIGGGGFMMYRSKAKNEISALDFREMAPGKATRDMYLDDEKNVIPRLSIDGHLAAGVPGSVAGMIEAHQRYGKIKDFGSLIEPAILLAQNGFVVTKQQAERLNKFQDQFKACNTTMPVFVKDVPWKAGDILIQKDLAWTLTQIKERGFAGFYEGPVAEKIVAEMNAGKGIISLEDLKNYRAKWRQPVLGTYKNYSVVSMPPPSSGGIALVQLLGIVQNYPLEQWGQHSPESIHVMTEAERRVYADRATHLGDSDFYPVPRQQMINPDYLTSRMEDFDPEKASKSDDIKAGPATPDESEETTHFSIIDNEGNAVSITTTINSGFGSKTVVAGAGFLLNNEMDDFSAKPGVPNFYGLIGNEANAIEPGKRMLSSMTPSIVLKDGNLFMVVGTPGGSTIITSVFQTILNVIEHKQSAHDAVQMPRIHHQWLPDKIMYEKGAISEETKKALEAMGHSLMERGAIGRVEAILVKEDGTLEGAADRRGDDHAAGY